MENINTNIVKNHRNHKVGTFTLGSSLIFFGILLMINTFTHLLSYGFVLRLWPVILILLGVEILISYICQDEDRLTYDKGAVFLIILLSFFSMAMACAEFLMTYNYWGFQ